MGCLEGEVLSRIRIVLLVLMSMDGVGIWRKDRDERVWHGLFFEI